MSIADVFDFGGGEEREAPGALLKSLGLKVRMGRCLDSSHRFVTTPLGLWEIAGCQILESFIWMQMLCGVCVTGGSFVKGPRLLLTFSVSTSLRLPATLSLSPSLSFCLLPHSSFLFSAPLLVSQWAGSYLNIDYCSKYSRRNKKRGSPVFVNWASA